MRLKTFYLLRYTIIEEDQSILFAKVLPTPKGYAICDALSVLGNDRFFTHFGVTYSFVGFHNPKRNKRFLFGKVAKLRKLALGEYQPGDIKNDSHDDWVPLLCLVDCETQHILIEKKQKFGPPDQLLTILSRGLNEVIIKEYNCKVFVKGKSKKNIFWQIVSESDQIFGLEMKLLSPNLFDANKTARESLSALKDLFSQDVLTLSLKNEAGHLAVPVSPTDDYIDYISEGEGEWKVTRGLKGRKKTFSSNDNIKTVDVEIKDDQGVEEVSTDEEVLKLIEKLGDSIDQDGL
jgi:hypothetical protein